jgi:hypothetical protein
MKYDAASQIRRARGTWFTICEACLAYRAILVPRALLTRGATRGSGQIQNRIP